MPKNFYPEKPLIKYERTPVKWDIIVALLKTKNYPLEILRSAFVIMANETGYGRSIICGSNIGGIQSDSSRWPRKWDNAIIGVTVAKGNREGYSRGFVVFDKISTGIEFLCERIQSRGLFIGGFAHKYFKQNIDNIVDLCEAYNHEWVFGEVDTDFENNEYQNQHEGFESIYKRAVLALVGERVNTVTINSKGGNVNLREGAGLDFKVINSVASKTVGELIERGSLWSKVKVKGSIGYINNDFLFFT